jgi:hypothetical protein
MIRPSTFVPFPILALKGYIAGEKAADVSHENKHTTELMLPVSWLGLNSLYPD